MTICTDVPDGQNTSLARWRTVGCDVLLSSAVLFVNASHLSEVKECRHNYKVGESKQYEVALA